MKLGAISAFPVLLLAVAVIAGCSLLQHTVVVAPPPPDPQSSSPLNSGQHGIDIAPRDIRPGLAPDQHCVVEQAGEHSA